MTLPASFFARPIAHRALHGPRRAENGLKAVHAAITAGYPIELDVQLASDDVPVVFHDYDLGRLTIEQGPVRGRSSAQLSAIPLNGDGGTVPTLSQVLDIIAGQVPLLIEVKDQDGALGPDTGKMGAAVAERLRGYNGDVAVMSFNPHHIAELQRILPDVPRGLVTDPFAPVDWPLVPIPTLDRLRAIPDYDHVGACFISHNVDALDTPRVTELKISGAGILCWTVRTPEQASAARQIVDNITFEGFDA